MTPARKIYHKYKTGQKAKLSNVKGSQIQLELTPPDLNDAELLSIGEPQVLYKVQLLLARVRDVNKPLNGGQEIQNLPLAPISMLSGELLRIEPDCSLFSATKGASLTLGKHQPDALADFLETGAFRRRKMKFNENGILQIEHLPCRQRVSINISKALLADALRKILVSDGRKLKSTWVKNPPSSTF
ncbi:hypothetical protein [Falsihalocynthiibacter arcticus]|uniref:Uncharacterized protein n=1 Tax=Falsihalocynthiibacter arcticus TaxID=1579316 RepID=A0A126V0L9_9RHOB|nr:hypothetical protein [Falsihalocynthiibacter arcticus]AML51406.1 hypothetical protein RC74_09200 [Falsihalocynthiibacter arcticus]